MEHIDLIRKIAWSFHRSTGLEWEDLFQEAALAYLEGMKTYDPQKGKITTHLWHCMSNRLTSYLKIHDAFKIKEWRSNINGFCSLEDVTIKDTYDPEFWWEALTEEAYDIAKVIISSPKPYLKKQNKAKIISRIKHVMKANGWDWRKVRRGLEDLRTVYS